MSTVELERDSAVPLYTQLEEIFRKKISTGEWAPGDKIPSENEFNRQYGVARMTARSVLTKLVQDGLLFRVAGKGTFVARNKIQTRSPAYMGVREQLERLGHRTDTDLLVSRKQKPSASVREHLLLRSGETVTSIERVRYADGNPVSVHYSHVPVRLAPTLDEHDTASQQLCVVLDEHFGLTMKRVEERLDSVPANEEVAGRLGMKPGDPILMLQDVIFNDEGVPFEYSRILFRGDKVQIHFDYEL